MQRIHNILDWIELKEGEGLPFPGGKRRVTIQVNSPGKTALYIVPTERRGVDGLVIENDEVVGLPIFLALVEGRDEIELFAEGGFNLTHDGTGVVYVLGSEHGEKAFVINPEPIIFTRIAERRTRNPEMEAMQHLMMQNMQKMVAQQASELEAVYERREAAANAKREAAERHAASEAAAAAAALAKSVEPAAVAASIAPVEPAKGVSDA